LQKLNQKQQKMNRRKIQKRILAKLGNQTKNGLATRAFLAQLQVHLQTKKQQLQNNLQLDSCFSQLQSSHTTRQQKTQLRTCK
jgi:hypothetical protein